MNHEGMELPAWAAARWPRGAAPPDAVWASGNDALLSRPMIAVIGSREASPRGLEASRAWAGALADEGFVVLSGGARGIDEAAHLGALSAGGSTVLVPPCGLDHYALPRCLRGLWTEDRALALTNLPPGTATSTSTPPRRNALVAALADAVIMVEAGLRSGTAYVVRWALERRAPLCVVRFEAPAPRTAAANATFRDKPGIMLISEYPNPDDLDRIAAAAREGKRTRAARRSRRPATPSLFGETEGGSP